MMHDKCKFILKSEAGKLSEHMKRCGGPITKYFLVRNVSRKLDDEAWTLLCRCGSHAPRSSKQLSVKEISFDEAVCHEIHSQ